MDWKDILGMFSPAVLAYNGIVKGSGALAKWFDAMTGRTSAQATQQANEQQIALQRETNAQAQYNLEHAHQIEAADLQAAGLNPWLSVGGGAQQANLQTAQIEPVDGSKMLQATTALMLMMALKMMSTDKTPITRERWTRSVGWK